MDDNLDSSSMCHSDDQFVSDKAFWGAWTEVYDMELIAFYNNWDSDYE